MRDGSRQNSSIDSSASSRCSGGKDQVRSPVELVENDNILRCTLVKKTSSWTFMWSLMPLNRLNITRRESPNIVRFVELPLSRNRFRHKSFCRTFNSLGYLTERSSTSDIVSRAMFISSVDAYEVRMLGLEIPVTLSWLT